MKTKFFILLIFSIPSIGLADIYKWTDEQGNIHFSDTPTELNKDTEKFIEDKKPTRKVYGPFEKITLPKPNISYQPIQPKINSTVINPITQTKIDTINKSFEEEIKKAKTIIGLYILAGIIYFILWLTALFDILKHEFTGQNKVVWTIVITFIPVIGLIAYPFYGIDQKIKYVD